MYTTKVAQAGAPLFHYWLQKNRTAVDQMSFHFSGFNTSNEHFTINTSFTVVKHSNLTFFFTFNIISSIKDFEYRILYKMHKISFILAYYLADFHVFVVVVLVERTSYFNQVKAKTLVEYSVLCSINHRITKGDVRIPFWQHPTLFPSFIQTSQVVAAQKISSDVFHVEIICKNGLIYRIFSR